MKIAIIGAGNMGGAIARGFAAGDVGRLHEIRVSNPSGEKLDKLQRDYPSISVTHDNKKASEEADIVILAVKPWLMAEVLHRLELKKKQVLVSLAAGVCFDELAHYCGCPDMCMFRIIPNTAIAEGESMTLIASRNADERQIAVVKELFDALGRTLIISENKIGAATSLASCGIAYVLKYVQAAMQAGVEMGVSPKESMTLVAQSLKGAAALLLDNDTHPAMEIDKVTTPGGITIKGINELEHAGFSSAIIRALKASNLSVDK